MITQRPIRTTILLLLGLVGWISLQAQGEASSGSMYMSLDDCIDYAVSNNKNVQNARFDEYIAKRKTQELIGAGLPQVNGSVRFTDNVEVPPVAIPSGAFDFTSGLLPLLNPLYQATGTTFPEIPTPGEDDFSVTSLGLQYQVDFSAQLTQLIFDGTFFVGIQAAKKLQEVSRINTERSKVETASQVATAYYTVLLNEERMGVLDANIGRLEELYDNTKSLYEAGFAERIDADRSKIALNNLRTEKVKAERMVGLARNLLKFQMGMEINQEVILIDTIMDPSFPETEEMMTPSTIFENRIEYKLLRSQEDLQNLNLKRYKVSYLPSLYGSATFIRSGFSPNFPIGNDNVKWGTGMVLGLQLNVPIFGGFQELRRIQQTEYEIAKIRNNQDLLAQSIQLEISNATVSMENSFATLESQKENLELSKEVYRVSRIKYQEGVGSNLEVLDAELTLRESETNYLSALYEYLLAKVELDRTRGELYEID